MLDAALSFANTGGAITRWPTQLVLLSTPCSTATQRGSRQDWVGAPATLYTRGLATSSGQVWQRKRDPAQGSRWTVIRRKTGAEILLIWIGGDACASLDGADGITPTVCCRQPASRLQSWAVAVGPEGLYAPLADDAESRHSNHRL
jgi:hypothetical protein